MTDNRIFIRHNLDRVGKWMAEIAPKQVEFAMMTTMNKAAYETSKVLATEMARVFDRPTSWVLKSIRYTKATRSNLVAKIDLDNWGNKAGVSVSQVLAAEINGGQRRLKRAEIALQRNGILPSGMACVPGAAAKIDRHGNMASSQIVQILAWFKAFGEQGYSANMKDAGRKRLANGSRKKGRYGFAYFALQKRHGKLLPGIYQRFKTAFGSSVKPVMIFVKLPSYRVRYDFHGLGHKTANAIIERDLPAAVANAIRTAR